MRKPTKPKSRSPLPKAGAAFLVFCSTAKGWQDHLGAGWRTLLVLKVGRKWITAFHAPKLATVKIAIAEWETIRPQHYDHNPAVLTERINGAVGMFDRYQWDYRRASVKEALDLLGTS